METFWDLKDKNTSFLKGNCRNAVWPLFYTGCRAEYCYQGNWTPFCKMDTKVGTVICKQLGHTVYSCKLLS